MSKVPYLINLADRLSFFGSLVKGRAPLYVLYSVILYSTEELLLKFDLQAFKTMNLL